MEQRTGFFPLIDQLTNCSFMLYGFDGKRTLTIESSPDECLFPSWFMLLMTLIWFLGYNQCKNRAKIECTLSSFSLKLLLKALAMLVSSSTTDPFSYVTKQIFSRSLFKSLSIYIFWYNRYVLGKV